MTNYSMLPINFNPKKYFEINKDIQSILPNDKACIEHYLNFGIKQNRRYIDYKTTNNAEFWNSGKNLLYFSPIAPDYDMSSGGNRLLQILTILKLYLKYNVSFFCNGYKKNYHIKKLQQLGITINLPDIKNNKYFDINLKKAADNNIIYNNAIFSWYDIADQYIDIVKSYYPNIKIIIDTVDIHWIREHRGKNAGLLNITDELLYSNKNKEINTYKKANVILTVTNDDKVFLQKEIGYNNNIKILSNIHDPKNIKKIEYNILFVGSYDHRPNIDAAQQAVQIYKKFQETKEYKNIIYQKPKLFIVGPNSKNINFSSDIYNDKQIIITDHVPDLDSIYSKCSVLLAPLNWGAGIKGKICDAAMANLAIITSPIGNEGINLTDSVNGFICTSNDSFVKSLCAFYKNNINEQQKIANLGQKHIHNIVSTQRSIDVLKNTLEDKHMVISIVAFNNKERLYKCLSSIIRKTSYKNYHIVVTDNSTTQQIENSIGDFLKENNIENKVTYIKNKSNEFFIIPNNKVMLDIKYKNSDVVLINDDIEIVSEDWLSHMVSSAYSSGDIGFVGGKTIFPDGRLAEAGAELYEDGFGRNIGRYDDPNSLIYNIPKYVGYCSGCFLLIKRETINKIGVFNTIFYPMYYEDSELQYRGHSFGLNTLYEPRAIAIHNEGSSAGTNIENGTKRFQEINRLKFIDVIKNNQLKNYIKNNTRHDKICIVIPTYYDRSAMLQLSLEYQKNAKNSENFETYIFVDPHREYGIVSDYDKVITSEYKRINWTKNSGKYSWYDSVKYIFDNTDYDYVITREDDVLISKDYLRMCEELALHDAALEKDDHILYFHIGAWEKPKGNPNKIVRSGVSSRSILINRKKFAIITKWVEEQKDIIDNDHMMKDVLDNYKMTTIAPETNRHGHVGIYGWSATDIHADERGQQSLFHKPLTHEQLYTILKDSCLSGNKLLELNHNKNPNYFWDFDPNINFTKLEYVL